MPVVRQLVPRLGRGVDRWHRAFDVWWRPWFRSFRVALLGRGQRLKGRCPVMQRSADRIMNSLKGGDVVMESPEAGHAVLTPRTRQRARAGPGCSRG